MEAGRAGAFLRPAESGCPGGAGEMSQARFRHECGGHGSASLGVCFKESFFVLFFFFFFGPEGKFPASGEASLLPAAAPAPTHLSYVNPGGLLGKVEISKAPSPPPIIFKWQQRDDRVSHLRVCLARGTWGFGLAKRDVG